jgi:hypothetical protein
LAGGLVGGLFYEGLTRLFLAQSGSAQVVLGGLGLVIIGACIGAFMPLARQVLSRGELRVVHGEQSGLVREVADTATIGRYDGNDLYLPDPGVAWRHAVVRRIEGGFEIELNPGDHSGIQVGQQTIHPGDRLPLQNGDHIYIGEAELEFVGR